MNAWRLNPENENVTALRQLVHPIRSLDSRIVVQMGVLGMIHGVIMGEVTMMRVSHSVILHQVMTLDLAQELGEMELVGMVDSTT